MLWIPLFSLAMHWTLGTKGVADGLQHLSQLGWIVFLIGLLASYLCFLVQFGLSFHALHGLSWPRTLLAVTAGIVVSAVAANWLELPTLELVIAPRGPAANVPFIHLRGAPQH